jgi:prevent-host-death family protein
MPRREDVDTARVRDHLGDLLNRARYRGDEFIVRRRGEPFAVLIPYETYLVFQRQRAEAMRVFDQVRNANPDADPDQVERDVVQAGREVRAHKRTARRP